MNLILSCEHAGKEIPKRWKEQFFPPKEILESHRGIDIGAKNLSLYLKKKLQCPLFLYEKTRLLIESNRSLFHPHLFSEYSKHFSKEEKKILIETLYLPYRSLVEKEIVKRIKKREGPVLHISMHTFTPILHEKERDVEIGFLFDPGRARERALCLLMRRVLKNKLPKEYRIKLNKPYHGRADGFTTHLRKRFKSSEYIGIEIEVNQRVASHRTKWLEVAEAIESSLRTCFKI